VGVHFSHEAVGVSPVIAGGLASGYWVAMFIGRIVLGSLAERIGSWRVMGLAVGGMVIAAALAIAATPLEPAAQRHAGQWSRGMGGLRTERVRNGPHSPAQTAGIRAGPGAT